MPRYIITNMFFYTYILKSEKDGKNYIGYTHDLKRRVEEHQRGFVTATAPRVPLTLIYYEACLSKQDALQREKYLKTTTGRRFIGKRLRSYSHHL